MRKQKFVVLAVLALAVAGFVFFDLQRFLTLDELQARQQALRDLVAANPWGSVLGYCALYIAVTALSLPGAAVMTLAGAAVFGFWVGAVAVSFASTIGATLAFLLSRFLFRDWVRQRFGRQAERVDAGMARDGPYYLFMLRLVPAFPFFVINLVMGLTPMRAGTFFWVSQLGMLPGTLVFVNAGTQLGELKGLSGLLSPGLIGAFALLGVFPLLARWLGERFAARRKLARWDRPRRFDRNLVVIGAGSGGLVASLIAAAAKSKVTLIERDRMGGDCLNTGCVPSKALLRAAHAAKAVRDAGRFGVATGSLAVDFSAVMRHVRGAIEAIAPHDSVARFTGLGVECIVGEARVISPYAVQVGEATLTTRGIVIASGARPFVPPIPGLDGIDYLTSDDIWDLSELPRRLLVLGGGPIGVELAQAFARLGSTVLLVEMADRLLPREDEDVSEAVAAGLAADGIDLHLATRATAFGMDEDGCWLDCERSGATSRIAFDQVLVAVGRRAETAGLGLDDLGIELNANGTLVTNEYLQTSIPTIFACGDVAGPYQFTHTASHQAWYASVNALFGLFKRFKADYSVIPMAVFCEPQVARVGLNELEATAAGQPFELTRYELSELDRAIAEGEAHGFVKVLTAPGKDRILGAAVVGAQAAEILAEITLAMRAGLGLGKILATVHPYPTFGEAAKATAGVWKRAHLPARLMTLLRRYNDWMRG